MRLLAGYYGERNAGDDAFTVICARALVATGDRPVGVLAKRLPRVPLTDTHPLIPVREWRGWADRLVRWRTRRWQRRGATLLIGGGSVFRSATAMAELARTLEAAPDGRHAAIGVSIGPFASARDEAAVERALGHFGRLGLRDRPSLERARRLAPHAECRLTFDLAPLLPEVCPELARVPAPSRRGLGIALCGPHTTPAQVDRLASLLRAWAPGRVDVVRLIEFNGGTTSSDAEAHARLAGQLAPVLPVERIGYDGDPRSTWQAVASLRGLLAMRLHAAVFGFATATPTVIVPYEEKCTAWAEMIGNPAALTSSLDELVTGHLDRLWSDHEKPALPVHDAVRAAHGNFELLR